MRNKIKKEYSYLAVSIVLSFSIFSFANADTSKVKTCTTREPSIEPCGENKINADGTITRSSCIVIKKKYKWPNGKILKLAIDFSNTSYDKFSVVCSSSDNKSSCQNKVISTIMKYAKKWEEYGNIKFKYSKNWNSSDIRIKFINNGKKSGAWSYLGTQVKGLNNKQTMNLDIDWWDDSWIFSTITHEFGHAIGLKHEQLRSDIPYEMNEKIVFDHYFKHGWSKEDVKSNVLDRFNVNSSAYEKTIYDDFSIMRYSLPRSFVVNKNICPSSNSYYCVKPNKTLSSLDKKGIAKFYPKTALGKNEKGDLFGNVVASGDFNNDGISDLAIAAPGESQGNKKKAGAVYIYLGTKSKGVKIWESLSQESLKENGKGLGVNEAGDLFGSALAVGDFNNDEYDDLAIGSVGESPHNDPKSGYVFLFRGTPTGLQAWGAFGQEGLGKNERGDKFGFSLATGDFNNDNKDDLAVGAPGESPGNRGKSGFVFLYKGSSTGLKAWKSFGQKGLGKDETGDQFGYSLASGDFNNDNRDDLAVGAPGDAPSNDPKSGSIFLFKGSQNNLTAWKSYHQEGFQASNEADDQFGHSLASGDFNGDGTDDLAVGTPGESPGNEPKSGNIFVFKGTPKGLTSWVGFDQNAFNAKNEKGDRFGHSLASGDFNGDGKDDLVIGTPGEAPGNDPRSGNIFVFKGTSSGLKSWVGFDQNSFNAKNENGDLFGYSLASGDFNGDKKDDLVVGTPGEAPGNDPKSGNVFLFKGTSRGLKSWFGFDQEWNSAN